MGMIRVEMRRFILSLAILCILMPVSSQDEILSATSVESRKQITLQEGRGSDKEFAVKYANEHGIPVRIRYKNGTVLEIMKISPNGVPQYFRTTNLNAAKTISTNRVWEGGDLGFSLDGAGIVVGVWDGGPIRTTHVEFQSRARSIDSQATAEDHATHVAGTIAAAGLRSDAHGMANKATVDGYDWDNDNSEMNTAARAGMLISNHSYGYVQGWEYNYDLDRWEWYGDVSISTTEDYNFGFYGEDAAAWDGIAYNNPKYLIVKSAGNDRGDGPAPGAEHYYWGPGGWTKSTAVRDTDGNGTYDCIGTQGTSKNIMTVGAVNDITGGYQKVSDVQAASFSSFGPVDDGRIKPDIVANGIGLISCIASGDNSYGTSSGTSMSSPSVAGSMALLQELYRQVNGSFMFASTLKAVVLHTADEAGNPGPDYSYGWGLMNTSSAAVVIDGSAGDLIFYDTLLVDEPQQFAFYSTGEQEIKITMVWTDPAGEVPEASLDPTTSNLVNDLDIKLVRLVDEQVFMPYVLDPENPSQNATTGDNSIDNVEQIVLTPDVPGYYMLTVSHKFNLENNMQAYSLVVSGLTKEYVASGLIHKNDVNGEILLTSAVEYQNNMDVKWMIETGNGLPVKLYFDNFNTESGADILNVYDGTSTSDPLLATFDGSLSNPDTTVTASGDEMLITFVSDASNTESGFYGRYCTVAPQGNFTVSGNEFPCINSSSSYYAIGQEGSEYAWDNDNSWIITPKSSNGIYLEVQNSSNQLILLPYNRCGSASQVLKSIQPLDAVPVLTKISGDSLPCDGVNTLYKVDFNSGTIYNWDIPYSWQGSSSADSILVVPEEGIATIAVYGENACGASAAVSFNLEVIDVPGSADIITEKVPPCASADQIFYVDQEPGYTYEWGVNSDWELLSENTGDSVLIRVGTVTAFVNILSTNKCGDHQSSRLFLTASLPDKPQLSVLENDYGYTVLTVTNSDDFPSIQWYLDGESIDGASGITNPLTASRNGLYTVASISDKECYNILDDTEGALVDHDQLTFVAYRIDESTVAIENSLENAANVSIVSMFGNILKISNLQPGYNEVHFNGHGVYLLYFDGYGSENVIKKVF